MTSVASEELIDLGAPHRLERLEAQVQSRLCGRVYDLRLELANGGLIVRGRAFTYYAKQLAQHAVMEAVRVRILINEITVS